MYGYVLQDWITIRGAQTITSVIQSEQDWLGFSAYQDIVFWLDVRELTLGGYGSLSMNYETAPTKDDVLFTNMVSAVSMSAGATPTVTKVLLSQNPTVPLARWVRWRISASGGSPSGAWDVTFRILCAANAVSMQAG